MTETMSQFNDKFSFDDCKGGLIDNANKLLIHRKFQECLDACNRGLSIAKQHIENDCAAETVECLCIVAIQAHAELNRWQEVLPFITQLYSGIEDCPAKIVQLCVLLHSHVKEYPTCTAITHIWLKNPNNFTNPKYHELCSIYISKVMVPTNKWDDINKFLESCPGLSDQQRDKFNKQVRKLKQTIEQEASEEIEELDVQDSSDSRPSTRSGGAEDEESEPNSSIHENMLKLKAWVAQFVPQSLWEFSKNFLLFGFLVYMIVTRTQFGMLSRQRLWAVWAVMSQLWRRMFAPFHTLRNP